MASTKLKVASPAPSDTSSLSDATPVKCKGPKMMSDSRAVDNLMSMSAEIKNNEHVVAAALISKRVRECKLTCDILVSALYKWDKSRTGETIFTRDFIKEEGTTDKEMRKILGSVFMFKSPGVLSSAHPHKLRALFFKATGWQKGTEYAVRNGLIVVFDFMCATPTLPRRRHTVVVRRRRRHRCPYPLRGYSGGLAASRNLCACHRRRRRRRWRCWS